VTTRDTRNASYVLSYLVDDVVEVLKDGSKAGTLMKTANRFLMYFGDLTGDVADWYHQMDTREKTLIVVNADNQHPLYFQAGEIPVPPVLISRQYAIKIGGKAIMAEVRPLLAGLTLAQIGEAIKITQARDGAVTPSGMITTKKLFMEQQPGIEQVDTDLGAYVVELDIELWAKQAKLFFLGKSVPAPLVPRGLLLAGPPGTGKTLVAKYLAETFKLPLFKVDFGAMMVKWQGVSENNLRQALTQVDAEAPCIVLLDEIEKVFADVNESGTATRMMAQLLWWLQEHKSRILTVMTTNNKDMLPPEVYRPGRVDKVFQLDGVKFVHAELIASKIFEAIPMPSYLDYVSVYGAVKALYQGEPSCNLIPGAVVVQTVYDLIRQSLLAEHEQAQAEEQETHETNAG
jgi:hypothetical protein